MSRVSPYNAQPLSWVFIIPDKKPLIIDNDKEIVAEDLLMLHVRYCGLK
jgi:hypothetical protein